MLGNILKKITAKRSRARVVDKLLSMGLVSERRELYKKRSRSAKGKSSGKTMVRLQDVQRLWSVIAMCEMDNVHIDG